MYCTYFVVVSDDAVGYLLCSVREAYQMILGNSDFYKIVNCKLNCQTLLIAEYRYSTYYELILGYFSLAFFMICIK